MIKQSDLMTTRICDLKLNFTRSPIRKRIRKLYDELDKKGILFRPICYFADEWFVPEGDPVIGIPFYLATPQLTQLEKKLMGEAEGDTYAYFMKLLRHEAGHAVSYAYKLYRKKSYRSVFGPTTQLFSDLYKFNRRSKKFVLHLEDHYAQSHPDEDFAETFAVWLNTPVKKWRKDYQGWGSLKKLEFLNSLMTSLKNKRPILRGGEKMCKASSLKYTLWTYYMRRRSILEHHKKHP